MRTVMIKEIHRKCASGYLALVLLPALALFDGWLIFRAVSAESVIGVLLAIPFVPYVIPYLGVLGDEPARVIATSHLVFNVVLAATFLPLLSHSPVSTLTNPVASVCPVVKAAHG